jgi:diguanylate cyclase (GGDEF)-like protein
MTTAICLDVFDATIAGQSSPQLEGDKTRDCCLVQIYPTNVVDGLVRLERENITLGRDASNDIALVDANVSRFHARLERCEDGYWLIDLGSTNGCIVDGQLTDEHLLTGGETVRLGSRIFKFLRASGIEAQYHSTVYKAMTRDGLTGAFNKSYGLDALSQVIARSRRCCRPMCVMMLDIDYFKKVNDTYGHLVGDEVLREFAKRITRVKREDDLLCRYGGEEFALILEETTLIEALEIARKCNEIIRDAPFATSQGPVAVTVSLGLSQLSSSDVSTDGSDLLERADSNLYRAKQTGRDRVCHDEAC